MNDEQEPLSEAAVKKTQSFQERMAALVARAGGGTSQPPSAAPSITVAETGPNRLMLSVSKGGGFCRIFPSQYNSVGELPKTWIEENWSGPSPWCKVEGQPEHPEFEGNLAALERALS